MPALRFEQVDYIYKVYPSAGGNMCIGDILKKEDGFYDFWPTTTHYSGYWPSYALREIADFVDSLNKPWEEQIEQYFKEGENA